MENALILMGGAVAIAGAIVLMDWLARRKDRKARQHPATRPS